MSVFVKIDILYDSGSISGFPRFNSSADLMLSKKNKHTAYVLKLIYDGPFYKQDLTIKLQNIQMIFKMSTIVCKRLLYSQTYNQIRLKANILKVDKILIVTALKYLVIRSASANKNISCIIKTTQEKCLVSQTSMEKDVQAVETAFSI